MLAGGIFRPGTRRETVCGGAGAGRQDVTSPKPPSMPDRHKPIPPEFAGDERQELRRDDDIAAREIAEHAIDAAPLLTTLKRTYAVSIAIGTLCTLLGSGIGALTQRVASSRDLHDLSVRADTTAAHVVVLERERGAGRDSLIAMIKGLAADVQSLSGDVRELKLTNCQLIRRLAADLRPGGCN